MNTLVSFNNNNNSQSVKLEKMYWKRKSRIRSRSRSKTSLILSCSLNHLPVWAAMQVPLLMLLLPLAAFVSGQVDQQDQQQQGQFLSSGPELLALDPMLAVDVPVQSQADNNQSLVMLDYANLDDEEPQQQQSSAENRLLWRRQVLLSEDESAPGMDSAEVESLVAAKVDYDSYRPLDAQYPSPAALLMSDVITSSDISPDNSASAYTRRLFISDSTKQQQHILSTDQQQQQQKIGPQFIKEPPSFIHYLNSSDLVIPCAASGNPQPSISWWHKSSQLEIGSLLDKRYVRYDNSLVISAFKAHDYEPDIHSTAYKCQASNPLGTIVSRDVVINAVIDQDYEVSVGDQFVTVNNDALFKCQLSPQARDLFQVIGWLEDGQHLIQAGSSLSSLQQQQQQPHNKLTARQQQPVIQQQQRALVLPDGQLYIQRVQLKDANKSYRCQIKNLLNSKVSLSSLSGRLFVTDANEQSGTSPRIVDGPKSISVAKLNDQLLLTCLAQGSPRPSIRWFRQSATNGQVPGAPIATQTATTMQKYQPMEQSSQADWIELGGAANDTNKYVISNENNLLLIRSLQLADNRAKFKCLANNTYGMHYAETEVRLELFGQGKLVEIEPKVEYINNADLQRQSIVFNCTVRASTLPLVSIEWLKNGRPLFSVSLPQYATASSAVAVGSSGHLNANHQHQNQLVIDQLVHQLNNNYLANGTSLFDDFNQELSAIEYHLPSSGYLSSDYSASFDESSSSATINNMQQHLINRQHANELDSIIGNDLPAFVDQQSGDHSRQSSGTNNFIVTSTSLNRLTSDQPDSGEQSPGTTSASPTSGAHNNRRLRQRVRLANRDLLVYQLQLEHVKRSDRGSYQCRARNMRTTLHATSHLMLKDNPPQFVDTFSSQLLGGAIGPTKASGGSNQAQQLATSLKCVASGSPLPEISWTLSGFPVPESNRFRVGDYVTRDGLIVSFVNISNVQVEDGGLYECSATNDVGQLRHSAWLNVTGPPYIRPMPNVSAVAGHSLSIMCPAGGWPIEQTSWFQNSSKLPVNHRQKLFPNGTLIISELNEVTDSGQYTCQAKSSSSDMVALNHVQISIKVPPVVEPFSFAKSLHRGQRYNIMCTVVRGDLPVAIRWFKDGRPLEATTTTAAAQVAAMSDLQDSSINSRSDLSTSGAGIAIKHLDPYSSTLTFASLQSHHRGVYSCEATNEAGRANQSSALVIHVPPEWRIEPKDLSVTVGKTAVIDCQADAFPAARIEWRLSQDLFREPPTEFKPIISSLYMRVFENGSLIIYNTQRTDAGYYLCQANNGVGPGLSRVIKLTVHVAAHFKAKIRTELVRRGQPVRLKCESIGDLPIEINWLRDKMPLYAADEPRYSLSKTLLQDGIVSELNIGETDRSDSALFTCITQNQYGNDDTNIQLIVQGPPDPPLEIRIHEYEARSVKISWSPSHSGNSPILKYIIMYAQTSPGGQSVVEPITALQQGEQVASGAGGLGGGRSAAAQSGQYVNVSVGANESSLLLQGLTPLTEYQFYMFAINSIGSSRVANEPIKFRTDDEAPSGPPLFVKAQAMSSRSIKVKWRAPEQRAHYGSISGFYVGYKPARGSTGPGAAGSTSTGGGVSSDAGGQRGDTFIYKTVEYNSQQPHWPLVDGQHSSLNKSNLEQECVLLALRKGQKYLITVQAFNSRGAGPASEPIITETWRIDVPDPPILRMVARTTHSIHLAWRLTNNPGGVVDNQQAPSTQTLTTGAGARPLQQAALMMRKNINDHIKSHQQFLAGPSSPSEIDLEMDSPKKTTSALATSSMSYEHNNEDSLSMEQSEQDNLAQANEPILGFILTRKQMGGSIQSTTSIATTDSGGSQQQTVEMRLPSDHLSQIVDNLTCGTRYQFTIAALNSVGVSAPSDPLIVKTEGATPVAPDKSSLLSMNSSSVLINLAAWHNGACAMRSFDIMFKASRSKKWTPIANYQIQQQPGGGQQQLPSISVESRSSIGHHTNNTVGGGGQLSASNNAEFGTGGANQLAQRSTITYNQVKEHQTHQMNANSTIVLPDLSSTLNYDLKILATNEAGSTEALYTFNTNGGSLSTGGLNGRQGELGDQQWTNNGSGAELFYESGLSDLFSSIGPMLPWFLFLLFVSLTLSAGCILIVRRRQHHTSSSSCSLSLPSSQSRSNQSSSNYYTASTANHQLESTMKSTNLHANARQCSTGTLNNTGTLQKLHMNSHQQQLEDSPMLGGGNQNIIHLGDIYGQHHQQQQQLHLQQQQQQQAHLNHSIDKSNYAYLSSQQHRPTSPNNTDITSVINGSETEMCLGASALNIASTAANTNHHQPIHDHQAAAEQQQQQQMQQVQVQQSNKQPQGYYVAPLLVHKSPAAANAINQLGKSSTLPANCHQQIIQQLIHQQQQQMQQQHQDSSQQHMIDSLVAANILQQQQCGPTTTAESYLTMQQAAGSHHLDNGQSAANMAALLEQQLQQQVYATVKRGCPRPPRLCDYAIYQCPNNNPQEQEAQQQQQQFSNAQLRCCSELAGQHQQQTSSTGAGQQQQHICYHPTIDQQNGCLQQQQQSSDYQQLRPVN